MLYYFFLSNLFSVCLYGGGNRKRQISFVTNGVDVVVATPGRLNDLMNNGILSMKYVSFLVSINKKNIFLNLSFTLLMSLFLFYSHHHHVVLQARISLTLSRHFSLSFIASGRSSGPHPVSSHSC